MSQLHKIDRLIMQILHIISFSGSNSFTRAQRNPQRHPWQQYHFDERRRSEISRFWALENNEERT